MKQASFLALISEQSPSLRQRLLRFFLSVLSLGYGFAIWFRNLIFDCGLKPSHDVGVPIIAIGNVTTGGTGKTPLVAFVVNWLIKQGYRPGIISRGYHALSDGTNDEKRVLALSCPGIPHIQDRNRVYAARTLVAEHQVDVVVADDAFQHRRLARRCNVVLIDALNPWGYGHLLPRGLLREPPSSLRRADIVILTRADQVTEANRVQIWQQIRQWVPQAKTIEVAFRPTQFRNIAGASTKELTGPVLGFCGIGNPQGFEQTLIAANLKVLNVVSFPDHHHYSQSDIAALFEQAQRANSEALVTTMKDLVKLQGLIAEDSAIPIWAIDIEANFICGAEDIDTQLTQSLSNR